jgi:cysteinyl-tRNA synthetase
MMKSVFVTMFIMPKPEIKLYNTLSRQLEVLEPLSPPDIRLYVCGPTVYDEAHLGHARCYITWDVLYRFLSFVGYNVLYTRNVTDVDDKILKRAAENGEPPAKLAQRFTERFHEVMQQLNVLSPVNEPRATEYVPQMVTFIMSLIAQDFAYKTPSGTVYYDTTKKANYGNLCHQNLDDLQSGARVDVDPEKRSPLDFALWKPAGRDEPLVWEAPWGFGRPGWHIECSTMSYSLLGDQLDIHAGGMDLIFPHHQNEIAQSEAFTQKEPFVKIWMHNGFVNVSGEKMSKSLGNFSTVEKVLENYDANTIRYFILTNHYRSPVDFSEEALEGAQNRMKKVNHNIQWIQKAIYGGKFKAKDFLASSHKEIELISTNKDRYHTMSGWKRTVLDWQEAMKNDLNTAQALACLNQLLSQAESEANADMLGRPTEERRRILPRASAFGAFLVVAELMGFDFLSDMPAEELELLKDALRSLYLDVMYKLHEAATVAAPEWSSERIIEELINERAVARAKKKWPISDMVRDELARMGVKLEDRKDQTTSWVYEPIRKTTSPR